MPTFQYHKIEKKNPAIIRFKNKVLIYKFFEL